MTLPLCIKINKRIGDMDYSSEIEGNASVAASVVSLDERKAYEKGGSTMILKKTEHPPSSKHLPARPTFSRRMKNWGMKTANQIASVLRHLPHELLPLALRPGEPHRLGFRIRPCGEHARRRRLERALDREAAVL